MSHLCFWKRSHALAGHPVSDLWAPYPSLSLTHKSLTWPQESEEQRPQNQKSKGDFPSPHLEMIYRASCHLECLGSGGKTRCQERLGAYPRALMESKVARKSKKASQCQGEPPRVGGWGAPQIAPQFDCWFSSPFSGAYLRPLYLPLGRGGQRSGRGISVRCFLQFRREVPCRSQGRREGQVGKNRGCRHEEEQGGKQNEGIKLVKWKGPDLWMRDDLKPVSFACMPHFQSRRPVWKKERGREEKEVNGS